MFDRVELFKLENPGGVWRYASGKRAVTLAGEEYTPEPIKRQRFKATPQISKNDLVIDVARDNPFVLNYLVSRVRAQTSVTVHASMGADWLVAWRGRVIDVAFEGHGSKITCESLFTGAARAGLRLRYQTLCPHSLFFEGCNANRQLFQTVGEITATAGNILTVPAAATKPNGHFTAGFMIWGGVVELMIYRHVGDKLTVDTAFPHTGAVVLYPGCDHTMTDCQGRFNNLLNFGGDPYIPTHTPFGGLGGI